MKVCFDVEIEPKQQPLEGESFVHKTMSTEDEARLTLKPMDSGIHVFERTFFDSKIFNSLAMSYLPKKYQRGIQVPRNTDQI